MKPMLKWTALALAVCLPLSAQAHRAWMLPSSTVLSGEDPWVTVDAAVSNDLFYFEHVPLQIEGVGKPLQLAPRPAPQGEAASGAGASGAGTPASQPPMRRPANVLLITAPDGSRLEPQNGATGRYRSTFDVHLTQKGTYKLAIASDNLIAIWKENGENRRWMGKLDDLAANVPAKAEGLRVIQGNNRMETFVTSGKPTDGVFQPTNKGLELVPVTHPNDLFAGEAAEFTFLLDGKPAAHVEVSVVPGGNRYRDQTGDFAVKTDAAGKASITWPAPGMYWIEAEYRSQDGVAKPVPARRAATRAPRHGLAP